MFFSRIGNGIPSSAKSNGSTSSTAKPSSVKIKTVKVKKTVERPLGLSPASSSSHSISKNGHSSSSSRSASGIASPASRVPSRSGSTTPSQRTTSRNGSSPHHTGTTRRKSGNSIHSDNDYDNDDDSITISKRSTSKTLGKAKSSTSKTRKTSQRLSKTPDLSRYNRASNDEDDYDDSSWQENFEKFSTNSGGSARESADVPDSDGAATPGTNRASPASSTRKFYCGNTESVNIIEARSLMQFAEYTPLFRGKKHLEYTLAMPCTPFREKYLAYVPKLSDEYNPITETEHIMELVANFFVPPNYTNEILNPSLEDCIVRRYRQAVQDKDPERFLKAIYEYNTLIDRLRKDGSIHKHMKEQNKVWQKLGLLPRSISRSLLDQVYSRVVSPVAHQLRDYKAFSNNVYGELLPDFMTRVFHETGLKSDMLFIDLGSGVGNCSLQAALEMGCQSWGVEMMPNASNLATKQQAEMEQRVKMYGLHLGELQLRAADFVHNREVHNQVSKADVLLVNNYAFDGKLNSHLLDMFLDLKEGCKIISLKSFVPPGHVISEHNIQSTANLLTVERKEFPTGSVSWTIASGPYFISTVDRTRLQSWLKKRGMI